MSEWNNSSAEERLEKWRGFRESLEDLSEEDLLNTVADFFAAVPIGARCIDFYTPESWPNPWELLYHKLFCTDSISLLIYHAFLLYRSQRVLFLASYLIRLCKLAGESPPQIARKQPQLQFAIA